ncbi:MAG: hypothetical protein AB8C84_00455 [Oligoflexales bacterium]
MIYVFRFFLCVFFFFLTATHGTTLPKLSATDMPPFMRYQKGVPQKESQLPALKSSVHHYQQKMKRLEKTYRGVLSCAVEMIEEGYQGLESIESGFFVLEQLPKIGEELLRLEASCKQKLVGMKKAERVSASRLELSVFYSGLPLQMKKIWNKAFQMKDEEFLHPMNHLSQTYEGRFGGFAAVGFGLQLGLRVKKKKTPLGRRFLYTRPLFPFTSGYGAGLVFGGVRARHGERDVEIAQDTPPGTRVMPGLAVHEGSVDLGGGLRQERFAYSPALGFGLWENLGSPFEDGLRVDLKPDYSFLIKTLSL